jgi:peptidyl-prolyl cis-trans isomerase A (cyclophilin A)
MHSLFLRAAPLVLVATLGGCGGGGSDTPPADVTSATADTPQYSQPLLFTVNGSSLSAGLNVSSAGCRNMTLSTTAPNISTDKVAYFHCTVAAVGAQQATVARASDGTLLKTVAYTVPEPQVTLNVSNGATTGAGVVDGNLVITLKPAQAPVTVDNFLAYVHNGFYDSTVIHRLSPGFVLQGGGYAADVNPASPVRPPLKATNAPIALEDNTGLSNLRLSVAMARTAAPDSATSQFFINLANNIFLDRSTTTRGYAVFGNVTAGAELVDAMAAAPCASMPVLGLPAGDCLPFPNLVVLSARQTR